MSKANGALVYWAIGRWAISQSSIGKPHRVGRGAAVTRQWRTRCAIENHPR